MERKKSLFSKEEINTGRQPFMDIAKAIAILFMVEIHLLMYAAEGIYDTHPVFSFISDIFTGGVFAAPVFMFCMGVGIAYSRSSKHPLLAKRGLDLYIKSWLLNIARGTIAYLIAYFVTKEAEYLTGAVFFTTILDILQFAALAFFLMDLLKLLKLKEEIIFLISVAMSVAGSFLRYIELDNYPLSVAVGHFVGAEHENFEACFPLFNWFIFVAGGLLFGKIIRKCGNVKKLLGILFAISLPIMIVYNVIAIPRNIGIYSSELAYYYMTSVDAVYAFSAVFIMLFISYILADVMNDKVKTLCGTISRRINEIYCIHWVLILSVVVPVANWIFEISINIPVLLVLTVVIFVISYFLAGKLEKSKVWNIMMRKK